MILLRTAFIILCYRALLSWTVDSTGFFATIYMCYEFHTYLSLAFVYHVIALLNDIYNIGYYQFKAVINNMTMNEQVLETQFEYFHNGNPFNKGIAMNVINFFCSKIDWANYYRLDNVISV